MGQKINPIGFRLPIRRDWRSRWFAAGKNYMSWVAEDFKIREFLQKKFNKLWLSNTASTSIGQTVDTLIFVTIAFAGLLPGIEIFEIIVTMIIVKLLIAICDTPFIYIADRIKKVREIEA